MHTFFIFRFYWNSLKLDHIGKTSDNRNSFRTIDVCFVWKLKNVWESAARPRRLTRLVDAKPSPSRLDSSWSTRGWLYDGVSSSSSARDPPFPGEERNLIGRGEVVRRNSLRSRPFVAAGVPISPGNRRVNPVTVTRGKRLESKAGFTRSGLATRGRGF